MLSFFLRSLGYGDAFVCGGAPDYKASCQYRLLVWTSECTVKNEGPLVRGDWANLEAFMREDYGKELPNLKRQIAVREFDHVSVREFLVPRWLCLRKESFWKFWAYRDEILLKETVAELLCRFSRSSCFAD